MGYSIGQLTAAGTINGAELIEIQKLSATVTITAATISAQASDNSYNDSGSGFVAAGFVTGMHVRVTGFTGNVANNVVDGVLTSAAAGKLIVGGADGDVIVDDAAGETVTITAWESVYVDAQEIADLASASTLQGTGLDASAAGFRGIPQNSQSANYTLVAADAGKHILHPSADANARTFTIPANGAVAFPVGTAVTFVNQTAEVVSIAITTDTLTLADTTTTGTRSLAQNGIATAIKITSTSWIISGAGLT